MPSRIVVALLLLILIETAPAAQSPHEQPGMCLMPTSVEDHVRQRPEADLRQLYLRCALVSEQRRLDDNEILACSTAGDALLRHGFGNDFDAMLAWAREHLAVLRAAADSAGRATRSVGTTR